MGLLQLAKRTEHTPERFLILNRATTAFLARRNIVAEQPFANIRAQRLATRFLLQPARSSWVRRSENGGGYFFLTVTSCASALKLCCEIIIIAPQIFEICGCEMAFPLFKNVEQ